MRSTASDLTPEMIAAFIDRRLTNMLAPQHRANLLRYLTALLEDQRFPPYRRSKLDHHAVADELGLSADGILAIRDQLQPIFDAVSRAVAEGQIRAGKPVRKTSGQTARPQKASAARGHAQRTTAVLVSPAVRPTRRPGRTPKPIIEFPVALATTWEEPDTFGEALRLHAERHGESLYHLYDAVVRPEDRINRSTLLSWGRNAKAPRSVDSFQTLSRIERRYALPAGYFRERIGHGGRACTGHDLAGVSPSERRRLAWHLPDDFNSRSKAEQDEILHWVRTVIISGTTEYRRYQAAASRQRYAIRFQPSPGRRRRACVETDPEAAGIVDAPRRLNEEMKELLRFKTSTLAAFGLQRNGVWGTETASQKVEHFGLLFGAFVASPTSEVQGFGVDPERLTFAMMIFPQVWDWYLQWRERRRGFYTKWEVDLLTIAAALTREETGWLRQTPRIGKHLMPIDGLITKGDIYRALSDWSAACDAMHKHARRRIKEIERVARIHRDPFEPILPVLEAASPVGEYRKITEEILRRMPDEPRHPRAAAEAVRSFLLLRLGLHTGLRQKNLRELLLCPKGELPTAERRLEDMKRGELRWSPRVGGWEILIPSVAFKNANSSFFGAKPFRLILPDLGGLYDQMDAYVGRHRQILLGPAADPGTFFVKTAKVSSTNAAYNQTTFYEAWRLVIQRYGIYNPYTGRGAIEGLLPHGPHNVRDVLATHILKQTGSYEQASYAIQDTAEMVAQHYGRFLPQDKAEIAARILNQVWEAA